MKPSPPLSSGAQVALLAVTLLGLLAMCLVAANDGFTHSSKRGGSPIFVSGPEAYLAAVPFFAMSVLALIAVLRARKATPVGFLGAAVIYCLVGFGFFIIAR